MRNRRITKQLTNLVVKELEEALRIEVTGREI
jgi:hypothetical protein